MTSLCPRHFVSLASHKAPRSKNTTATSSRRQISLALCTGLGNVPRALAFDWWFNNQPSVGRDPVEPFTIYGSIVKKYFIEQIVNGRIVSRKRGFTASACMNILEESMETPELQGVPTGLKVTLIGDPCCGKGEGKSREDSCSPPCEKACDAVISGHLDEVKQRTGYELDPAERTRVKDSCVNQCFRECTQPGNAISFILPFRPRK